MAETMSEPSSRSLSGQPTQQLTGIAHIVLRVTDWGRTAHWYEEVLGFERRKGEGFTCLVHPEWNFILLLLPTDGSVDSSSTSSQRLDHLALHVPTLSALGTWQERLASNGMDVKIDHVSVGDSITLHDPEGLEVELFCPSEGSPLLLRAASDGAVS